MSKSIADYSKLKAYAEDEEKKKAAIEKAKQILEESGDNAQPNASSVAPEDNGSPNINKEGSFNVEIPSEIGINEGDNIFSNLEKVDQYFRNQKADAVADSLNLETLENNLPTSAQVEESTKQKVDAKFNKLKENIEDDYAKQQSDKQIDKQNAQDAYAQSTFKVNEIYDNASSAAQNQALKRGLARSSIIIEQLDGIEKDRATTLSNLAISLNEDLAGIESEINALNTAKERALASLDLDYAVSLNDEISSALDSLNKKQKEIVEFNNKVEQLKAEYNLTKREKDTKDLKEKIALGEDYGYYQPNENLQQQYKIKLVLDYLNTFSKAEALKKLTTDSTYAYYLGNSWSDVYYNIMQRKN